MPGRVEVVLVAELLVVEDDVAIGRALETGLRGNRHRVLWVRSGEDAVSAARRDRFDLVLLDLGLPDRDGVEVCRDIRTCQPGCVLVILTALVPRIVTLRGRGYRLDPD